MLSLLLQGVCLPLGLWRGTIDKRSAKSFIRINDRIRAREIRVIDENGEQLGILPPFEALKIARERGLDLVEGFLRCGRGRGFGGGFGWLCRGDTGSAGAL